MGYHPSLLLRGGLFALLMAGAAALYGADYKIDRGLLNTLADDADATAPFFVVFGERAAIKPAYRITDRIARARFVEKALSATANGSQAGVRGYLQGRRIDFTPFWIENKIYVPKGSLELARTLALRPEVVAIIPEVVYQIPQPRIESEPVILAIEWGIDRIRAPLVWGIPNTGRGQGIVVANIDTGVQYTHPALISQYRGAGGSHLGNWKDPFGTCGSTPCDNNGHGTHTMGTMVGDDGAGNQVGVAPLAKWIACKGCRSNSCYDSDLLTCAQWVVNPDGAVPPHIVNNSWGGGGGDSWYRSYVSAWVTAGIYPAFSNGNSGPNCTTSGSPGDYPESISAGAIDINDSLASFSSRGPSLFGAIKPDLVAPGVNVRSSVPTNSYANFSGTSMASPHVAGAVALLWANSTLDGNIAGTEQVLKDSAVQMLSSQGCGGLFGVPNNSFGWGRVDVKAAVDLAGGGPPTNQPPTVTITAPPNGSSHNCGTTVNFTASATDLEDDDTALTASTTWTDNGASIPGSGGSVFKSYDCTATGNHNIVASVTDSGGLSGTDPITINIVNPSIPNAPVLSRTNTGSTVTLDWTNVANETGYEVQRKKNGQQWSTIATKGVDEITHSDSPGKGNWSYRVRALGAGGNSAWSNIVK